MSDFNIISYESLESTNETLKRLTIDGAGDLTVVVADKQTHGKGRQGRKWIEGEGNLYFSILKRNPCRTSELGLIPIRTAIACVSAIGSDVKAKWPNDIILNNNKVGGVLIESSLSSNEVDWVIIGIGINVSTAPSDEQVDYAATSLSKEGIDISVKDCLSNILKRIKPHLLNSTDGKSIEALWVENDIFYKKEVKVETVEGDIIGINNGINAQGALLVELPDGTVKELHQATTVRAV